MERVRLTDVVRETVTVEVPVRGFTYREGDAVGLRERVGLTVPVGLRVRVTEADALHVARAVICVRDPEGLRV